MTWQRKLITRLPDRLRWWWDERRINRAYHAALAQAKTAEEREIVHGEFSSEFFEVEHERRAFYDLKLLSKARRHFVPTPPRREGEGMWEHYGQGMWFLTEKGTHELVKGIMEYQKARRDLILGLVTPLITILTGLVGAITGLVALLSK